MIKVAVGIIIFENKILLCQRKKSAHYPLKWEFPGGKLIANEKEFECLQRELFEELNIKITSGEIFHNQNWIYKDSGEFFITYFLIEKFTGKIKNNVFEKIKWIKIENLKNYDTLEGNAEVIELLTKLKLPKN